MRVIFPVVAFLALLAVIVVVSRSHSDGLRTIAGEDSFPSETLTDWVSYADQIAVVRVTSERTLPPDPADSSGGLIGRSVHLQVERTLWLAHGTIPRVGADLIVAGWIARGSHRDAYSAENSLRIEPGDRVVIPFTTYEDGSLAILSPHAVVPVSGTLRGSTRDAQLDPAVRALKGRSAEEMAHILATTDPDPLAAQLSTLAPWQRKNQVLEQRSSPQPARS